MCLHCLAFVDCYLACVCKCVCVSAYLHVYLFVRTSGASAGWLAGCVQYIGVRAEEARAEVEGAGAWAEFGPLFDGREW